ncbi:MocR-like transcription factor YczR [Cumulibacter manganitolerans]|uniref:MocR-like transcription factor YczR n=1 Tax=Cumulibacter manganitolerans TaxID=1884992 RepID=UPI001296FB65|nr:PLP-dependent aminotransferase family protein [Cumulibacter manganitolerans]
MVSSVRPSATALAQMIGGWQGRPGPAYRGLAAAIRQSVLDGRLAIGARLPAERELSRALGVSRTTVAGAYSALRDDGWLASRRGSGSVVTAGSGSFYDSGLVPVRRPADPEADIIDLTTAGRAAPDDLLDAAIDRAVDRMRGLYRTDGYFPLGVPELREAIAARYVAAGVETSADQILVTNGAQHGFSLALGDLTHALDRVIVESPTYPMALDLIRHTGRVPSPVGLLPDNDQPWMHDLLRSAFRQSAASTAFLMPDFQNPTGALMDAETRALVMQLSEESGTVVMVDESFRLMALEERTLPPPMSYFDARNSGVSIGSLSKPVWGGLRIGWVRAGSAVVGRLGVARALGDMSGPLLDQLIAVEMMPDLDAAARRQAARMRENFDVLRAALAQQAPSWEVIRPAGGATVWVRLPQAVATDAARLAPRHGVLIVPGTRFGPDGTMDNYLRIPLTPQTERLRAAIPRIVTAVQAAEATDVPARVAGWLT